MQKPLYAQNDAIFINRQKEIKTLHQQLHSLIQDMNDFTPIMGFGENENENYDDDEVDGARILNQTEISSEQEIRLLIREIQELQTGVLGVQRDLNEYFKYNKNSKASLMSHQLLELSHILEDQLIRAKKLLIY